MDWIDLGQQLDTEYDELRDMIELAKRARGEGHMPTEQWEVAVGVFAGKIEELNRRIMGYNGRVPHGRFQRPLFPADPDIQATIDRGAASPDNA